MVLRDIAIAFFQILHEIVFELVKPLLHEISTGLFDGVSGAASGIKEVFVTLKAAVKEVWLYSSTRNISRLLATAVVLTMLHLVAKRLHKIMETNTPAWTRASNPALAAPAAPGP